MKLAKLSELVEKPEVHRRVLGTYRGPYALGVTQVPDTKKAALTLSVEDEDVEAFPREIELDGERVPVMVQAKWRAPRPQ